MRKLLLASVAGLGAWGAVSADANAQATGSMQSGASYSSYSGGVALPTASAPTPGTVVVRLNGRFRFYAAGIFDKDAENNAAGSSTGTVSATTGQGTLTGTNKLSTYTFAEYARLYPGFDGVAANGLKYGASLEIRQDGNSAAGGGAFGSVSGQSRARAELQLRREWGYLGTNELGTFRFGSTDQPTSLYMTGNFENFNDGGWNGDVNNLINPTLQPQWPFADIGNYYTTSKAVYLSPQIFGFDLGVSFEPSTANVGNFNGNAGCAGATFLGTNFTNPAGTFTTASGANSSGAAGPGCDRLYASPSNAESARRTNTFDALIRYRGSFGPVGLAATAAYVGGSHVRDNSGLPFNNNPLASVTNGIGTTTGQRVNYDGLSVGDFGAVLTFGGLSVGGHYMTGRWNQYLGALVPKGFPDSDAWIAGASYTIGPVIVGAQWFVNENSGDLGNAFFGRRRRDQGVALGGTYSLAPGVSVFLSGLWGQRKQNGFDFVTGQGVSATTPTGTSFNNKVTSSLGSVGLAFSW